ncbi:hypothetical protein HPB52_002789 [Rhipicephalus sanguineus]|uniref:Uncharacterized protein n=1 Tax=Rhipicephalus sanguineus TaxID=34632 RepID=A0A9D4T543_RHISA|nr:hypothetical protein HPB52_002789 [Rhipicephalus sanguineus]
MGERDICWEDFITADDDADTAGPCTDEGIVNEARGKSDLEESDDDDDDETLELAPTSVPVAIGYIDRLRQLVYAKGPGEEHAAALNKLETVLITSVCVYMSLQECRRLGGCNTSWLAFTSPYLEPVIERIALNAKVVTTASAQAPESGAKMLAVAYGSQVRLWSIAQEGNGRAEIDKNEKIIYISEGLKNPLISKLTTKRVVHGG